MHSPHVICVWHERLKCRSGTSEAQLEHRKLRPYPRQGAHCKHTSSILHNGRAITLSRCLLVCLCVICLHKFCNLVSYPTFSYGFLSFYLFTHCFLSNSCVRVSVSLSLYIIGCRVKSWSNVCHFVLNIGPSFFCLFLFSKISFSLQKEEDKKTSCVKSWSNYVAQHTWTGF